MQDRYIGSSEDLSLFSDACGSSPNIEAKLKYVSYNKNVVKNKDLTTFIQSPENARVFNQAFKNSLRKNMNSQVNRKMHHKNLNNAKNLLKISTQKMELGEKQKTRPISSKSTKKIQHKSVNNAKNMLKISAHKVELVEKENTKPILLRPSKNLLTSKEEQQQIAKKNREKKLKVIPLTRESDVKKSCTNGNATECIEIEVFMPIIDEKCNRIYYPSSKMPIIKRYFVNRNNYHASKKPPILKNKCYNKNINENSGKKISVKSIATKKPQEMCSKSVNNPGNKADAANTVEIASMAKKSPVKESKSEKASNLGKREAIRNFLKESIFDTENMLVSKSDIEIKHTCSKPIEDILDKSFSKISNPNSNNFYANEYFRNPDQTNKCIDSNLPFKKTSGHRLVSDTASSCSSDIAFIKEMAFLEKTEASRNRINKILSLQETATKSIFPKISGSKLISNNKRSNRERNALAKNESKFPVNRKVFRNTKSDENGWRRSIYTCPKVKSPISKWSRRLENVDALSMESWIDRCKYLRAKEDFLGKCQSSPWRSS